MKNKLCVSYQSENRREQAQIFASQHELECMELNQVSTELALNYADEYIELRDMQQNTSIHVDFISGALAHRQQYGGGRGQAIAKAIGLKQGTQPPTVIDATAGLGKDSFVMACLDCPVTLIERSPIISQLVFDAIQRDKQDSEFNRFIERGFKLVNTQATEYLKELINENKPDVIYLDPMYPERKKTALVKKNMQILQKLLGHDDDTEALITSALKAAKKRVVVKRPKGAEVIGDKKPTMSIESKKTRYDVYVCKP
jgi:16S rRNA (guanine1516-N2)-methyltransferase